MNVGPQVNGADNVFVRDCPTRTVLDHVTSRWGVLVLVALREEPLRFYQLRDRIGGISEKMLSQNLRVLTEDGLITRRVEPVVPVRVSYALTDIGRELTAPLRTMIDVIAARLPEIIRAREAHAPGAAGPPPAGRGPAADGAGPPAPPRSAA
ncbi:winged helix-turn-helix transcriptional regulator [Streptomyces johnsoniae]|uniref:Helix-turn-helix domain-containing protein n=1 Tax=Streptomyces johnsoniae TaxID=3075532 RepID=A0ABU2S124_9ACTN|nr:helix-turn-helix domain-containing protein [Streptomyces sp. DSM 41886]MDT0442396.1 helix-turn-helix domain-containing protein [Streptomyces sp. DSM 41886]